MAAHLAVNHDVHDADRDALAWLEVKLGSEPLVPPHVRETCDPHRIIAAAIGRLDRLARLGRATVQLRNLGCEHAPPGTLTSRTRKIGDTHG